MKDVSLSTVKQLIQEYCSKLNMSMEEFSEYIKERGAKGITVKHLFYMRQFLGIDLDVVREEKEKQYVNKICSDNNLSLEDLKQLLVVQENSESISREDFLKLRGILKLKADLSSLALNRRTEKEVNREKEIISLWNAGKTYKEIALHIGRTLGGTIQTVNRLRDRGFNLKYREKFGGIPEKKYDAFDISSRIQRGESYQQIAEVYKVSYANIRNIIHRLRNKNPSAKIPYLRKYKKKV